MKPANFAPVYMAGVYPRWAEIARSHGYALAVHGSCARDLDVVFVPWGEEVSPPKDVLAAITEEFAVTAVGGLEVKPHGRLCQTLAWMGDCFADVSFIVPVPTPPQPSEAEVERETYGYSDEEWRVALAIWVNDFNGEFGTTREDAERWAKGCLGPSDFSDMCYLGNARAALSAMSRPDPEKLSQVLDEEHEENSRGDCE